MPQQINLLAPILLAPKRYFSAMAVVQAIGLLLLAELALTVWLRHTDTRAAAEHQQLMARFDAERQSLLLAQAGLPQATDPAVLQQQLQALRGGNADRSQLLRSLGSSEAEGRRHSDLLALVARTQPAEVWLTDLRWSGNRLELAGGTLDTAALRPWLTQLAAHPLLEGQELQALQVERVNAQLASVGGAAGDHPTLAPVLSSAEAEALRNGRLPVWAFHVTSAPNRPAAAASSPTR